MNNKIQKATVAIIAVIVFLATFFGSTREQIIVEAKKIVTDSNNINNDYLIGIQSLNNALGAQGLVILDIRSSKEYNEGHIPGAINVSWNDFVDSNSNSNNNDKNSSDESNNEQETPSSILNPTKNWTSLINKNKLTTELQNLGISNQSTVVIYGDSNGDDLGELGKLSWMFRMVGIQSKMLNGGYKNWVSQGLPTTTIVPTITKTNITIQNFLPVKSIKKVDIKKNISKIKILELVNDVKNQNTNLQNGNASNIVKNGNDITAQNDTSKANAINSATNSNTTNSNNVELKTQEQDTEQDPPVQGVIQIKLSNLLNPNGTIKPVNQLQALFSSKGINKNDIILFYNTNKGNLAFLTLMLNMAGYNNIQTYDASLFQVANITTEILENQKQLKNNSNQTNVNAQNTNSNQSNSNSQATNNTQTNNQNSSDNQGNNQLGTNNQEKQNNN